MVPNIHGRRLSILKCGIVAAIKPNFIEDFISYA